MTQPAYAKEIVLYADDDPDDLELLENAFLVYPQMELKTFGSGAGLISHLRRLSGGGQMPCLIILDINMPLQNGWDTFRELKKSGIVKGIPVFFFSTSAIQTHKPPDIENEVHIIAKPASVAEMGMIMDKIIDCCPLALQKKFRRGASH